MPKFLYLKFNMETKQGICFNLVCEKVHGVKCFKDDFTLVLNCNEHSCLNLSCLFGSPSIQCLYYQAVLDKF